MASESQKFPERECGGVPAGAGVPYMARPRSWVSLLGLSIKRDLTRREWIDLRGKPVASPEDVAAAAQALHSPGGMKPSMCCTRNRAKLSRTGRRRARLPTALARPV